MFVDYPFKKLFVYVQITSQQKFTIHLNMKDTLSTAYIIDFWLLAFIFVRMKSDADLLFQTLLVCQYCLVE